MNKSDAVSTAIQNKINRKTYRIPTDSIRKIELFADIVYRVKKHLDPDYRKEQKTKLKNALLMNSSLFWENFYTRAEVSHERGNGGDLWLYSNYDDIKVLCGGDDIMTDNVMFILTDISDVSHNENSNRVTKKTETRVGGKIRKSISQTREGGVSHYHVEQLCEQVKRNLVDKSSGKREYKEIDSNIIIDIILPLLIEDGGLAFSPVQVFKNDTFTDNGKFTSDTNNWSPNKYRIAEDVYMTDVVEDLGMKISKPVAKRLTKIYTKQVNTYGIGNSYCWGQFEFNNSLAIPTDLEMDNVTKTIITNISNPEKYQIEYTDDRIYTPLNQLSKEIRNTLVVTNNLGEVDLVSAQANMLISLIVGDFDVSVLYGQLNTNMAKKALKKALSTITLTDAEKDELRSYCGDFYENIINTFGLTPKRKTLKTQALSLFNCTVDEMWNMKDLMDALKSSNALQQVIDFLKELKSENHRSAYQVLFKMESLIIRKAVDSLDYNVGLVHDAIICPKDKEQETLEAMNTACESYGVIGGAEIEEIEDTTPTPTPTHTAKIIEFKKPVKRFPQLVAKQMNRYLGGR